MRRRRRSQARSALLAVWALAPPGWIRAGRVRDPAWGDQAQGEEYGRAPGTVTSHRQVPRHHRGRSGWRRLPQA